MISGESITSPVKCSQLDDLLQQHGVRLIGPGAGNAVALEHTGYALFPLEDEEVAEQQGVGGQEMIPRAALVPLHMMPDEEDSSSRSSEGHQFRR
jgi:hypothetical protein